MEKKKMMINAATCDIRNITEEILNNYENVLINSSVVISNAEAQAVIGRCGNVSMNAAQLYTTDEEVEVSFVNGSIELSGDNAPANKTILMVNGILTVKQCSPEFLENYMAINVNGSMFCPKSMAESLTKAKVNGEVNIYPDGAILLKNNTLVDRNFVLRAKDSIYWANRLLFLDVTVDAEALKAKGARFDAEEVIIAESLVERLIDTISEEAEIKIVPDRTRFVNDDADLDLTLIDQYGSRLFINGDLSVKDGAKEALKQIFFIQVSGTVRIYREYVSKYVAIEGEYEGMEIIEREQERTFDKMIEDKVLFKIDQAMLNRYPGGIHVSDCAVVKLDPEISAQQIAENLCIEDCGVIKCSLKQESAVTLIAKDCGNITTGASDDGNDDDSDGGDDNSIGGMLRGVLGGAKELLNTKVINTASYKF